MYYSVRSVSTGDIFLKCCCVAVETKTVNAQAAGSLTFISIHFSPLLKTLIENLIKQHVVWRGEFLVNNLPFWEF